MMAVPTRRSVTGIESWNARTSAGMLATPSGAMAVEWTSRSAVRARTERSVSEAAALGPQNACHRGQGTIVERGRCHDQAAVAFQPASGGEVQRLAVNVGHAPARLLDDQAARGV